MKEKSVKNVFSWRVRMEHSGVDNMDSISGCGGSVPKGRGTGLVQANVNRWVTGSGCGWKRALTFGVGVGEEAVPGHLAAQWQRQQVVPGLDVDDAVQVFLGGGAQDPWRTTSENTQPLESTCGRIRFYRTGPGWPGKAKSRKCIGWCF